MNVRPFQSSPIFTGLLPELVILRTKIKNLKNIMKHTNRAKRLNFTPTVTSITTDLRLNVGATDGEITALLWRNISFDYSTDNGATFVAKDLPYTITGLGDGL